MAGKGKRKCKKNKGKSDHANKQHGTSNSKLGMGQELSKSISRSKETGKESLLSAESENSSRMMEELLAERVEQIYLIALEMLTYFGYGLDVATRAILMNGSISGGANILNNILSNALAIISEGQLNDSTTDSEPIFQDILELARFSTQTLINLISENESNMTKTDAISYLLRNHCLAFHDPSADSSLSKDHEDLGNEKCTYGIDIGKMLKENTTCLQRLNIDSSSSSSSSSRRNEFATLQSEPVQFTVTHPDFKKSDSSSGASLSDSSELMKSFKNCPDGFIASLEDSLRTSNGDAKDALASSIYEMINELQIELKETREWATKVVIKAAKKVSATGEEHKDLLKQREERGNFNLKMIERQNHYRSLRDDLYILSEVKHIREAKNLEYKSEIAAYNLSISETQKSILVAQKNERKALKKSTDVEKQNEDLKRLIEEEKQKLAGMARRMEEVNKETEEAKLKLSQQREAKERARVLLSEEKGLNRRAKENSKNRQASLRRELDMKYRQCMDDQIRLEDELSKLKFQHSSRGSSSTSSTVAAASAIQSSRSPQNSRQCMICGNNDVSVVFLPCAHKVICSDCNEEVYDVLEDRCPCCKALIEKRAKVYDP